MLQIVGFGHSVGIEISGVVKRGLALLHHFEVIGAGMSTARLYSLCGCTACSRQATMGEQLPLVIPEGTSRLHT